MKARLKFYPSNFYSSTFQKLRSQEEKNWKTRHNNRYLEELNDQPIIYLLKDTLAKNCVVISFPPVISEKILKERAIAALKSLVRAKWLTTIASKDEEEKFPEIDLIPFLLVFDVEPEVVERFLEKTPLYIVSNLEPEEERFLKKTVLYILSDLELEEEIFFEKERSFFGETLLNLINNTYNRSLAFLKGSDNKV